MNRCAIVPSASRHLPGRSAQIAGAICCFLGLLVLLGWVFDNVTLKCVLPGLNPMKPTAAIGFVLLGVVIAVHQLRSLWPRLMTSAASAVLVAL